MSLRPEPQTRALPKSRQDVLDPFRRALQEKEEWSQDLAEYSQDLLCIHDLQGRLLSINSAPARALGYSVKEMLGMNMRDFIAAEFRAEFDSYLARMAQQGEAHGLLSLMTRSGERRVWSYHNTLRTQGVAPPVVCGIAHDVTEQLRTEKLLRQTSEDLLSKVREGERTIHDLKLFRALLDQSNDAIEVLDPATFRFLDVNERAYSDLGYSREELLSLTVCDINPGINPSALPEIRAELEKSGSLMLTGIHKRKDGTTFPVEVSVKRVHLDRDYIVSVVHDLTQRKVVESQLRASEGRYRAVHELSPVGIAWADEDGRFLKANPKFCELVGRTEEELLKLDFKQITHPDDLTTSLDTFQVLQAKELQHCQLEKRYVRRDGTVRWASVELLSMRPVDPDRPWYMVMAQDITERKQAEERLRKFERLVESLDEMIVVVDREYRYTLANASFLRQRQLSREQVIGHSVAEVASQRVFDDVVKQKLDECFAGNVVKFEMSLNYPGMGWRQIASQYSPVEGPAGIECAACVVRDITESKQKELRLAESESRYRAVHEISPVGICWIDAEGHFFKVNPEYCAIVGRSEQDLLGRTFQSLTHPDDLEKNLVEVQRLLAGEIQQVQLDKRYMRPDGSFRWVNVSVAAMGGGAQGASWLLAIVQDITARKQAEEALRESEARERAKSKELETVLGLVPVAVCIAHDADCKEMTGNQAAYEQCGVPPGTNISQSAPPEQRPEFRVLENDREVPPELLPIQQVAATGISISGRYLTVISKDGRRRETLASAVPLLDETGKPRGAVAASIDITELKRTEKALQAARDFSENLIQTANVIVLGLNQEGNITLANWAAEEISGYTTAELKGRNWSTLMPRERFPRVWEEFERAMSGSTGQTFENPIVNKSGQERLIAWRNNPLKVDETIVGTIWLGVDITDLKRAEQALKEREQTMRLILDHLSVGVVLSSIGEEKALYSNPRFSQMFGYKVEEHRSTVTDWWSLAYPDPVYRESVSREWTRRMAEAARTQGEIEPMEVTITCQDGTQKFVRVLAKVIGDLNFVTFVDLTARKRAEEALRHSDLRFRIALEGSPIEVFNQDRDLRYTWVYNPEQGRTVEDYLGKTDEDLFGPDEGAKRSAVKRTVLETGQGVRQEFSFSAGGKTYYSDMTVEALRDATGQVIGINGASVDITEMHEITEELRLAKEKLSEEKLYLEEAIGAELGFGEIIGRSDAMKSVMEKVAKVAPNNATVLLLGETGTGKELVARALHQKSQRKEASFIKMNCAAIPSGLLESELFGHEKGAFTGAVARKLGRLELADHGTLFLDEIGEIPLALQPKLLRVLQDQEFERLGGTQTIKVNFRLLAATNRDLLQGVRAKEFRSDLYYRLNVFPILIPPLRDRRDDIPLLVEHFVRKYSSRMGKAITSIPAKTMEALVQWSWPGNIRELENFIERSVILTPGMVLQAPLGELHTEAENIPLVPRDKERESILRMLKECKGQLGGPQGAAARLGLKRTTLQSKLNQLGIKPNEYRA